MIKSKVVFKGNIRTPTINYGIIFRAKYLSTIKKLNFKVNKSLYFLSEACQICYVLFLTKFKYQTADRLNKKERFSSQNNKLFALTAEDDVRVKTNQSHCFSVRKCNFKIRFTDNIIHLKVIMIIFISLLLIAGDIESNPGPRASTLSVKTYNARGLKNQLKLKRVLNTRHKSINSNRESIIFLQETHLEESDRQSLEIMWRHKFIMSPGTNRQCGCIILYDPGWSQVDEKLDNDG